jgi:hypothetical protein
VSTERIPIVGEDGSVFLATSTDDGNLAIWDETGTELIGIFAEDGTELDADDYAIEDDDADYDGEYDDDVGEYADEADVEDVEDDDDAYIDQLEQRLVAAEQAADPEAQARDLENQLASIEAIRGHPLTRSELRSVLARVEEDADAGREINAYAAVERADGEGEPLLNLDRHEDRVRWMLPELAGIGATPAARASLAGVAKRWAPAISPTSLAAISGPNPGSLSSCGAICSTRFGDLALEPVDRERELAQAAQLVARDPHAHRLLRAGEPPADADRPLVREQRAARQPQLGPQIVQMPQQRAVELDAMADQPFAVVDEQPQVELRSVQVRGREGLQALLQRGAGDVECVDRVRLAAPAGALACLRGQVRRDPHHALAALDQEPLQRSGDVAAILKRPHAVAVEAARPPQQGAEAAPADLDGLFTEQLAGCGRHGGDRVRTLVSVRAKHDHDPRPPLDASGADVWWTRLARGGATHLSSHARHPDRRRATKHKEVRP